MTDRPAVAAFRPDDERSEDAATLLESLGAEAVIDPMLAVEPTGATPREDADYVVLTSKTGVELAADRGWSPGEAMIVAIGERTARALREAGYEVGLVPAEYSSAGLVELLGGDGTDDSGGGDAAPAAGARVEVARSDHGSDVLTDGLDAAGAYVHETILYRLVRPDDAGTAAERAAAGDLDGACFTSSLTVEHFLEAADERGLRDAAIAGLDDAVVGAIGEPTRETAREAGLEVDVVPERADFEALARAVVERIDR